MNGTGEDTAREEARAHWVARADAWARTIASGATTTDRYNRPLLAMAEVAPGQCVLDLGSGTGQPAVALAQTVGVEGFVVALDHAPAMLAGARKRAEAASVANVGPVAADMAELPFGDGRFDAVTARFSLMTVPDKAAALREALRVLRPGRRAAFLVWGPETGNDRFRALRLGALAVFGPEVAGRPNRRHALGGDGTMAALLREAGFADVEEHDIVDVDEQSGDQRPWESSIERTYGTRLAALGTDARARLAEAMQASFAPFLRDGVWRFNVHARLGVGRAPD